MLGLKMNFFPMGELPEAIREALANQIDRSHMASTASYHSMFTLFDELTKEQMVTLGGIFHILSQESAGLATYLEGITATYMRLKYDTCMGCGSSHTPNFEEAKDQKNPPEPTPEEYAARLVEYNLDEGFVCRGCGQRYASLADRMMKKPDDCGGCHQKSKWG